ncbi:Hypothetical protein domain-containing, RNA-Hypothetical protein, signal transduction-associated protein [Nesidiocoris tenuis]|uniref:K Homology domain-containing protein n=2 Tax=Nesidiocoris tenuis TaxID=355587 RepID=A0ABN7AZI9_9HEMI|nr:Hypothetical protein domain-containing, RNA-Hypothetical protein, signal transduction-associated protein [Nesidiocoris tenuis]
MAEQQTENVTNEEPQQTEGEVAGNEPSGRIGEYIKDLNKEKEVLDPYTHSIALKLIDDEIARAQKGYGRSQKVVMDVYRDRPIRASVKISVPIKEYPRFNFVGKLLGPKGSTLKRLQEETMTKMAILGKGSMRDKAKEDELRNCGDPKYNHLNDELHVEIFATGPPAEAHARLAFAMVEIRKYMTPDVEEGPEGGPPGGGPIRGRGPGGRGGFRGGLMPPPPGLPPRAAAGANKVMSILDRARMSMEGGFGQFDEGFGYDMYNNGAGGYGEFEYGGAPPPGGPSGRWKAYGPKSAVGGMSRFPPRAAPYGRPPKQPLLPPPTIPKMSQRVDNDSGPNEQWYMD